jgi:hypothetical protein
MAYMGNLRQYPLIEVLRQVGEDQWRGRLVIERAGWLAEIYCEGGNVVHVWRNGQPATVLQRWIGEGFIAPMQIAQMSAATQLDPSAMSDSQMARIAVETGAISFEQLVEWVQRDAVTLIGVLLDWPDGDFRFEREITPPAFRLVYPIPIPQVLGAITHSPLPDIVLIPIEVSLDDTLEFTDWDDADMRQVQVTPEQWRLLALVDGESTLGGIAAQLTATPLEDSERSRAELRRNQEIALRVARELLQHDVVTLHDGRYDHM